MLDERFVHLLHMFMFFVSRWRGSKKFEDWEGGSQNLELGLVADLGGGGEGGQYPITCHGNMFDVNIKDTRTTPLASSWCLYC